MKIEKPSVTFVVTYINDEKEFEEMSVFGYTDDFSTNDALKEALYSFQVKTEEELFEKHKIKIVKVAKNKHLD